MASVGGQVEGDDTGLDFEKHLESSGFSEYDKIKAAIDDKEITLEDILEANEDDIKAILADYDVKRIQQIRFVRAIKLLPNSKLFKAENNNNNDNNGDSNQEEQKTPSNASANTSKSVLLSSKEQDMIDDFSKISDKLTHGIIEFSKMKKHNIDVINNIKEKITTLYNDAMTNLNEMIGKEEKAFENDILTLKTFSSECSKIRKDYEIFIISNDKEDIDKRVNMEEAVNNFKTKINEMKMIHDKFNDIDVESNDNIELKMPTIIESSMYDRCIFDNTSDMMYKYGGSLVFCGYDGQIKDNGKTFHTDSTCLARTDESMIVNSGKYKILWQIETLQNPNDLSAMGICTDYYKNLGSESQDSWYNGSYHIGWGGQLHDSYQPNRLACGWNQKDSNTFYKECKFTGDALPQYNVNDIIGLIYDSDQNTLEFEKNGKLLNSKLENMPNNLKLYWFVARLSSEVKFSVVGQLRESEFLE